MLQMVKQISKSTKVLILLPELLKEVTLTLNEGKVAH